MAGRLIATILEKLEAAGASAVEIEGDAFSRIGVFEGFAELFRGRDGLVVDLGDEVPGLDAFACGRAVLFDRGDDHALGSGDAVLFGQVAGEGFHGEAEVGGRAFTGFVAAVDDRGGVLGPFLGFDLDFEVLHPAGTLGPGDVERDQASDFLAAHLVFEVLGGGYATAVDGGDDVGGFELGARGRAVLEDLIDHNAVLDALLERVFELGEIGQGADPDSQPGPGDPAVGDEFVGNFAGQVAGDGETDAGVHAADEGVDADGLGVDVHQGAAAVARIDIGVGLDEVLVHGGAFIAGDDVARSEERRV